MVSSVNKFIECAKQRDDEIFRCISTDLKNNTFLVENVKWHKSCYSTYTSNENVKYHASTQHDALVSQPSLNIRYATKFSHRYELEPLYGLPAGEV